MFIYKITVVPIKKVYIGFDTNESYKKSRWKVHLRTYKKKQNNKLYSAMFTYGEQNCNFEILEDNIESVGKLALLEIQYIKKYNSYRKGLNSTLGGDGLGKKILQKMSEKEILEIKKELGRSLSFYNKNIKWAGTTAEDRKKLTAHLHTDEIYKKKSNTLKDRYAAHPEEKLEKYKAIKKWREQNKNKLKLQNKKASDAAALINRKKIKVEHPDGSIKIYESKIEFARCTNQTASYIIKKTKQGLYHNGYKIWEI